MRQRAEIAMHPASVIRFVIASCLALAAASPGGQPRDVSGWPVHPLSFVTPAPPGGAVDLVARVVADKLAGRLGQPVVVESRPGADGILPPKRFSAKPTRTTRSS
jgi:tripartite-type tricarboxylate transporter receptor subunit TctC